MFTLIIISLLLLCVSCSIWVILRLSTIWDYEYLHIVEHSTTSPEAITQVAIYLIERLFYVNATSLQLDVYHRQSVYKYCYVIAILVSATFLFKLIYYLKTIIVDVGLVNQLYVLCLSVVECDIKYMAFVLQNSRFILYWHLIIWNHR